MSMMMPDLPIIDDNYLRKRACQSKAMAAT